MRSKKRQANNATVRLQYDEREKQVLDIAADLFEDRGYERTSLKNIASEAQIEASSLYYYFDSKEDLYVRVMGRSLGALTDMANEIDDTVDDPWEKLEKIAAFHCQCMLSPTVMRVVFHPRFPLGIKDTSLRELKRQRREYENVIRDIVDDIELAAGVDRKLLIYTFLSSINYSGLWYKKGGEMTPESIAAGVVAILRKCAAEPA